MAAASVVLPKPPGSRSTVSGAVLSRRAASNASRRSSACRGRGTNPAVTGGAMNGTRVATQPRRRCAMSFGHSVATS